MKYFIKPPADVYLSVDSTYCQGYKTYSEYNYLRPGISSYIKSWHFEMALDLTKDYFHKANVIDFGCADGVFIPSLSKYFNHVLAIDQKPSFMKTASGLVKALNLSNVELLCNDGLTIRNAGSQLSGIEYHILYLLETLEHVGDKYSLYDSKIHFLQKITSLISREGVMVISVPIMIGLPFLIQRVGLALTGSQWEPISRRNLLKASFFMNTTNLERQWNGGHLGFNHRKLESLMKNEFQILKKRNLLFQVVYLIGKK
jgi:2-polyprenyl-3-methyl-5-hydroxy-6-metoxy-1,4-benzoquinol methylase